MHLCAVGAALLNQWKNYSLHPLLFAKKQQNFARHFPERSFPQTYSLCFHHRKPTAPSRSVFVDVDAIRSTLARRSGPLFVCVYVIAWQGSAPSRLCEGLNVIHWAETVLLPASLSFCLTPLMAAQYKRGQCHKQSLFIDEKVLECCTLQTG